MSLKDTEFLESRFRRPLSVTGRPSVGGRIRPQAVSTPVAEQAYAAAELASMLALGLAAGHLHGHLAGHDFLDGYIWPSILTVALFGYLNYRSGLYDIEKLSRFTTWSGNALASLFGAFAAVALVGVAVGGADASSGVWFGAWLILSIVAVLATRALGARVFASGAVRGAICRQAAIFGTDAPLDRAISVLSAADSGVRIAGIFRPHMRGRAGQAERGDGLKELIEFGRSHDLDTVIIALPPSHRRRLRRTLAELSVLPAEVKLLPDIETQAVPLHGISSLARTQFIDLQHKPIPGWGRLLKAAEDYTLAAVALALLAPFLLMVAIAIKLDSPGPVLFRQQRHGLNNRVITVLKFRTMQVRPAGEGFRQATPNDRRVTRVGRILRRTSIDELPQLLNVLRGEMSIVGPRPHAVEHNAAYAELLPAYNARHRVRPGITGWAQINDYRGPTFTVEDMRKRLEHDLHYIDNWSILFDLSIIAATPFIGLTHKNAV